MELIDYKNTGKDQFSRDYPIKITLKNGQVIVGYITVIDMNKNDFKIHIFKEIENINDWITNKIEMRTKTISISKDEIRAMEVFNDY